MTLSALLQKYSTASNNSLELLVSTFESPIGNLVGIADEDHLYMVGFEDSKNFERMLQALHLELSCSFVESKDNKVLRKLEEEFAAYFDGKLKKFIVPIRIKGSGFQRVNIYLLYSSINFVWLNRIQSASIAHSCEK